MHGLHNSNIQSNNAYYCDDLGLIIDPVLIGDIYWSAPSTTAQLVLEIPVSNPYYDHYDHGKAQFGTQDMSAPLSQSAVFSRR